MNAMDTARRHGGSGAVDAPRAGYLAPDNVIKLGRRMRRRDLERPASADPIDNLSEALDLLSNETALTTERLSALLHGFGRIFDQLPPSDAREEMKEMRQHLVRELARVEADLSRLPIGSVPAPTAEPPP